LFCFSALYLAGVTLQESAVTVQVSTQQAVSAIAVESVFGAVSGVFPVEQEANEIARIVINRNCFIVLLF